MISIIQGVNPLKSLLVLFSELAVSALDLFEDFLMLLRFFDVIFSIEG
jgi:hypothetical protein